MTARLDPFEAEDERVVAIYVTRNPEKLIRVEA